MEEGMTPISDLLVGIVNKARENNPIEDGDYKGDDGLVHCGKCKTPKECRVKFGDKDAIFPCICKCRKDEIEREEELRKKRERMDYIQKLKKNSLMDEKFASCTFDTIKQTKDNAKQIKICKRYAEKFSELFEKNQGLLLYGDVGTGKTHLACCIGNYLMESCRPVFATSLVKILSQAKSFRSEDDEEAYIRKMNNADLLILDDLGAERSTDYALEIVYNIIDSRYRTSMPMIVTTNLSLEEMQNATDIRYSRIYDRVLETCYPVEFVGRSWRMKEAAGRYDKMKSILEGDE